MLSRNFRLQKVGNLSWLQTNYNFSHISFSIDELVVLDVSRGERNINEFCSALKRLTEGCFVPIAAGGGIRSIEDARTLLHSGADKVVLNSVLYEKNGFVGEMAREFGAQCIVASTDIKMNSQGGYQVWSNSGITCLEDSASKWLARILDSDIGELYINSMDKDGTGQGYDMKMLDLLPYHLSKPVILAGGVGNANHLMAGLRDPRVDAVSTAHLFNFVGDGLKNARNQIIANGVDLPIWNIDSLGHCLQPTGAHVD